ncbi:MAG TPA: shikimate kinase [Terriglobales bacterium]|nr:shikimate kinase [Terriglobales bacterium]
MPRAIFLVGFMGSGKNTVGQELARHLSWAFADLDGQIESREARSIPEIFSQNGEPYFRGVETDTLRGLLASLTRDTVVALGGGAFAQDSNREMLRPWPTIFLEAPVHELWQRCLQHEAADGAPRPLRGDREQFVRRYNERLPFYRAATYTIATSGKSPAEICREIGHTLQLDAAQR